MIIEAFVRFRLASVAITTVGYRAKDFVALSATALKNLCESVYCIIVYT